MQPWECPKVVHCDGRLCAESEGKEQLVSRFDLVSTTEEEGIQLLLHCDEDGMQNKEVVGWCLG